MAMVYLGSSTKCQLDFLSSDQNWTDDLTKKNEHMMFLVLYTTMWAFSVLSAPFYTQWASNYRKEKSG